MARNKEQAGREVRDDYVRKEEDQILVRHRPLQGRSTKHAIEFGFKVDKALATTEYVGEAARRWTKG